MAIRSRASASFEKFPASVKVGEREISKARVWVSQGLLRVFVANEQTGTPELALEAQVTGDLVQGRNRWTPTTIETDQGAVEVMTGAGCGCRHPLKRFNPESWSG